MRIHRSPAANGTQVTSGIGGCALISGWWLHHCHVMYAGFDSAADLLIPPTRAYRATLSVQPYQHLKRRGDKLAHPPITCCKWYASHQRYWWMRFDIGLVVASLPRNVCWLRFCCRFAYPPTRAYRAILSFQQYKHLKRRGDKLAHPPITPLQMERKSPAVLVDAL